MKKGKSTNADYEDDLLLFLGVESISDVTFFSRLQIGEAVFHSRAYKRVSRRNNYTIAYQQGDSICYGYIEAFFSVRNNPRVACGAVIAPMSMSGQHVCKSHEVLGRPISHIICLHEPNKNRFTVVPLSWRHYWHMCLYQVFRLWCELCSTFPKPYWKRLEFILGFPFVPSVVNLNAPWLWHQKLINKDSFFLDVLTFAVVTFSPLLCIEHRWRVCLLKSRLKMVNKKCALIA